MSQEQKYHFQPDDLIQAFSLERFGRYMDRAGGDQELALALYALNTQLSESLYTPLQILEVVLRNRIHHVMTDHFGEWWFNSSQVGLLAGEQQKLEKAKEDLRREQKKITPGQLVATLSFGFWTSLLSRKYDSIWQQYLNVIARKPNGKGIDRKHLNGLLQDIRRLRNRTAHHEPILFMPVMDQYLKIVQIIDWISPPAATWCKRHSRFLTVHPATI